MIAYSVLVLFLSTLPARGATPSRYPVQAAALLISIHAPREGSDRQTRRAFCIQLISIHAPREGSDVVPIAPCDLGKQISIHAPREGSDRTRCPAQTTLSEFLSTLPARGATRITSDTGAASRISIHAPREGSDPPPSIKLASGPNFYPRSPRGERQLFSTAWIKLSPISIHAPREGSDIFPAGPCAGQI